MDSVSARVHELMPQLVEQLSDFVRIPSVSFPAFPELPVQQMAEAALAAFQELGPAVAELLEVPGGPPAVWATFPVSPDAPTLLLYSHYDVQPAPLEQGWSTDPWTPTLIDGRLHGRGAADDKSGIVMHLGALAATQGERKVNVNVLLEGDEEYGGHLLDLIKARPELVQCDAMVIADSGNQEVGRPALTSALRGVASCRITVRSLKNPVHSGLFGGPVPDALVALTRILSTMHDKNGEVAVAGLHQFEWQGAVVSDESLRKDSGLLDDVQLIGSGSIASRLWSRPSINIVGMDVPATAVAANVLIPEVSAIVSMRVAPGGDADKELGVLIRHLHDAAPWGVQVEIEKHQLGDAYLGNLNGPFVEKAQAALTTAYKEPVETIGSGGSIPLVAEVLALSPGTEIVMWGAEDTALARIHGANESVDLQELERMTIAEALLLAN